MLAQTSNLFRHALAIILLAGFAGAQASVISLEHDIHSDENLYHVDWGHWFVEAYGLGVVPSKAVSDADAAWNFGGVGAIDIEVSGIALDAGTGFTDADGMPLPDDPCWDLNSCWFDLDTNKEVFYLPVYSVIGLWSSTADFITPILDPSSSRSAEELSHAAFLVGTEAIITAPDVEEAFLFLAGNDGVFSDNISPYFYTANITYRVPEPSSLILLLVGMLSLIAVRRLKSKA